FSRFYWTGRFEICEYNKYAAAELTPTIENLTVLHCYMLLEASNSLRRVVAGGDWDFRNLGTYGFVTALAVVVMADQPWIPNSANFE
ncbi:unnamed protein product, partial [Sphenostylis stenocarpa]